MKKNYFYLTILLFLSVFTESFSATYYSRQTGSWSNTSTWSTSSCSGSSGSSVPGSLDSVVICGSRTVTVTANTNARSVTISTGGTLQCGNGTDRVVTISSSGFLTIQNGGTYIHNTNQTASTSIFNGTESFGTSSTVQISRWDNQNTPVFTGVSSNFGNVILNYDPSGVWNNTGLGITRTITGNLTVGSNCTTTLDNTNSNVSIALGGKLYIYGDLRIKDQGDGNTSLTVTDSVILSGGSAYLAGVQDGNGSFTFSGQNILLSNTATLHCVHNGTGDATFNFNNISTSSSFFYGIYNDESSNAGKATFTGANIYYSDNYFNLHYGCNTESDTVALTLSGSLDIDYNNAAFPQDDYFAFCNMASFNGIPNTTALKVTIGGNLIIHGLAGDFFVSNRGSGNEIINITGNFSVAEGTNYFNGITGQTINGHNVTLNVGGTTSITGGILYLSTLSGTLDASFGSAASGAVTLSNGILNIKSSPGAATVNFNNAFSLSGGSFFLYNDTIVSNDIVAVTVKGNFTQTGGVISFCNNDKAGGATNVLNLSGATVNYTSGSITRGLAGTGSVFGQINYNRIGATSFVRTNSHNIQQVKQNISSGTTVNVPGSSRFQVASHITPMLDMLTISNGGILNMNGNFIESNSAAANCGISVLSGGKLRTSNFLGLYNNSTSSTISNAGNMNFSLDANSTIEVFGGATKQLTGIGVGNAIGTQHKYGILEINHSGTPNTTWVYPTSLPTPTTGIYIRTQLKLTQGELNLINSASTVASGGRTITIENSSPTAITRTSGYIKSEAENFSALVKWQTGSGTGAYVVPFGYNNVNYIPTTLEVFSGSAGDVSLSTYHTGADNQQWPPGVTNLTSVIGLLPDNRDATADRFWYSDYTGSATAYLTMSYASSELPIPPYNNAAELQANRFNTSSLTWDGPIAGQYTGPTSVTVPFIPATGTWAMANIQSPLPVELLSFTAVKKEGHVLLEWSTASEKENDYFMVERSEDLKTIVDIGRVNGAGNSNVLRDYSLPDKNPLNGIAYYRLRQVDINGDMNWSDWVKVRYGMQGTLTAYPNPANDFIYIDADDTDDIDAVRIIDITGTVLYQQEKPKTWKFDVSGLKAGSYLLQAIHRDKITNTTFIINH